MTTTELRAGIEAILAERSPVPLEGPDIDLLEMGVLDSTTLVEVLLALEEKFGAALPIEEIEIDDLRTVDSIAAMLTRCGARSTKAA